MAHEHIWQRRVEFPETDAAGIVHFTTFFRYMENAEHDFFRSVGLSIHDTGIASRWPRASAHMDFQGPLRFEDMVAVHLAVSRIGRSSLHYRCRVFNADTPQRTCAFGRLSTVHCVLEEGKLKSAPMPEMFLERIQVAPDRVLEEMMPASSS